MKTQSTREHAVTERYLNDIFVGSACCGGNTGNAVRPQIKVVLRISNDCRLTCCAGRSVDTHHLFHRSCEQTERIVVAQIGFCSRRYVFYIAQALDLVGGDTRLVKLLCVERHIFVAVINRPFQSFELQRFQLAALHCFNFLLKKHLEVSLFYTSTGYSEIIYKLYHCYSFSTIPL